MRRAALVAVLGLVALAPSSRAADIAWSAFGTVGDNGWYRSDVWINWDITNVTPPLMKTCDPVHLNADTKGTAVSCTVTDGTGDTTKSTTPIKVDQTSPRGTGATSRSPDENGWFNHSVDATFSGSDATSGIASCSGSTYSGPDAPSATVTGSCRDNAGNVAKLSLAINYDATPPTVTGASLARNPDVIGWYLTPVAVTWTGEDTLSGIAGCSQLTYAGPDGDNTRVSGSCTDQAGNTSSPLSVGFRYGTPLLHWRERKRADYYNLQLFRKGRKLLSTWPRNPRLRLRRAWRYHGHSYRLLPGLYKLYVWPGYGKVGERRYGHLVAYRKFRVA